MWSANIDHVFLNKFTLKYELDLDFVLFAISSPLKDYRLCYFINKNAGLNLSKVDDHEAWLVNTDTPTHFSKFAHLSDESETEFYLIANRGYGGGWLVPEMRQTDYFLLIKNFIDDDDLMALDEGINAIGEVLVAGEIKPEKLKSKENLIF